MFIRSMLECDATKWTAGSTGGGSGWQRVGIAPAARCGPAAAAARGNEAKARPVVPQAALLLRNSDPKRSPYLQAPSAAAGRCSALAAPPLPPARPTRAATPGGSCLPAASGAYLAAPCRGPVGSAHRQLHCCCLGSKRRLCCHSATRSSTHCARCSCTHNTTRQMGLRSPACPARLSR